MIWDLPILGTVKNEFLFFTNYQSMILTYKRTDVWERSLSLNMFVLWNMSYISWTVSAFLKGRKEGRRGKGGEWWEKREHRNLFLHYHLLFFQECFSFSPTDLSKDISLGMFLSLCSNSHCSLSNTDFSIQVGSWEDLTFNSLVMCALLNSNNSWIESNNAGFGNQCFDSVMFGKEKQLYY